MTPDGERPAQLESLLVALEGIEPRMLRAGFRFLEALGVLPDIELKPNLLQPFYRNETTNSATVTKERPNCTVTATVTVKSRDRVSDHDGKACITPEYEIAIKVVERCTEGGQTKDKTLIEATVKHIAAEICGPADKPPPTRPPDAPTATDGTITTDGKTERRETVKYPHGTTVRMTSDGTKVKIVVTLPDGSTIEATSG